MRRFTALATATVIALSTVTAGTALAASTSAITPMKVRVFSNCTKLNKVYPHGVGKSSKVRDRNSRGQAVAKPVTNFTVSKALYLANAKRDRDKDGIACEKR